MLLLDSLPVCISYVDSLQVYRYNNQTYEVWFRRPRETVNGRHMQDILGPEAFERIKPKVETALSGREVHFEMRIPYKDAGMRDVEASYVPHIAEDGLVLGFFALIRDVSERKQAEQAIYRQSLFFNNAHDAVSTCDLSGNIQSWNARAKELYGYSAEETVG
ncbi:MAG: PAS domain-containing protein, partial [Pseudohongiellaceae bacterium]